MHYTIHTTIRKSTKRKPEILLFHRKTDNKEMIQLESKLAKRAVENVEKFYGFKLPAVGIFLQYLEKRKRPRTHGTFYPDDNLPHIKLLSLEHEAKIWYMPREYTYWLTEKQERAERRKINNLEKEFERVVAHEVAHLFNHEVSPYLSSNIKWFDEGLAQYVCFKNLKTDGICRLDELLEKAWKPEAKMIFEKTKFQDFSYPINFFEYQGWVDFTMKQNKEFSNYLLVNSFMKYLFDIENKEQNIHDFIDNKLKFGTKDLQSFDSAFLKVFNISNRDAINGWKKWLGVKK